MKAIFDYQGTYFGSGTMSDAEALTYQRQGFVVREITESQEIQLLASGLIERIFTEPDELDFDSSESIE